MGRRRGGSERRRLRTAEGPSRRVGPDAGPVDPAANRAVESAADTPHTSRISLVSLGALSRVKVGTLGGVAAGRRVGSTIRLCLCPLCRQALMARASIALSAAWKSTISGTRGFARSSRASSRTPSSRFCLGDPSMIEMRDSRTVAWRRAAVPIRTMMWVVVRLYPPPKQRPPTAINRQRRNAWRIKTALQSSLP